MRVGLLYEYSMLYVRPQEPLETWPKNPQSQSLSWWHTHPNQLLQACQAERTLVLGHSCKNVNNVNGDCYLRVILIYILLKIKHFLNTLYVNYFQKCWKTLFARFNYINWKIKQSYTTMSMVSATRAQLFKFQMCYQLVWGGGQLWPV